MKTTERFEDLQDVFKDADVGAKLEAAVARAEAEEPAT